MPDVNGVRMAGVDMEHRIRSAAIVVDDSRMLLVKHQLPETGEVCWIPPGGGVEGSESVFECARRETWEETGLTVHLDRVVYLGEFLSTAEKVHHFGVFILGTVVWGTLTIANVLGKGRDEDWIKEARFLGRHEMSGVTVYPEFFKTGEFWDDLSRGFPGVRYLGIKQA